jgi:hypothetical protein
MNMTQKIKAIKERRPPTIEAADEKVRKLEAQVEVDATRLSTLQANVALGKATEADSRAAYETWNRSRSDLAAAVEERNRIKASIEIFDRERDAQVDELLSEAAPIDVKRVKDHAKAGERLFDQLQEWQRESTRLHTEITDRYDRPTHTVFTNFHPAWSKACRAVNAEHLLGTLILFQGILGVGSGSLLARWRGCLRSTPVVIPVNLPEPSEAEKLARVDADRESRRRGRVW